MIKSVMCVPLIFAVVGGGLVAATAEAQTSTNTAGFLNSGQTATIDCVGGQAAIRVAITI